MFLRHAFRNPNNIATFLLLQFQISVENAEMKLLHKSVDIQLDFILEKLVFQCFFSRIGARSVEALFIILKISSKVNWVHSISKHKTDTNSPFYSSFLLVQWIPTSFFLVVEKPWPFLSTFTIVGVLKLNHLKPFWAIYSF